MCDCLGADLSDIKVGGKMRRYKYVLIQTKDYSYYESTVFGVNSLLSSLLLLLLLMLLMLFFLVFSIFSSVCFCKLH